MSNGQQWEVMALREYTDGQGQAKTNFTRVGRAFTNRDGSINVLLDAVPLGGKLQLQIPLDRGGAGGRAPYQGRPQGQQSMGTGVGNRQRYGARGQGGPQRFQAPPPPPPDYPDEAAPPGYDGATDDGPGYEGDDGNGQA